MPECLVKPNTYNKSGPDKDCASPASQAIVLSSHASHLSFLAHFSSILNFFCWRIPGILCCMPSTYIAWFAGESHGVPTPSFKDLRRKYYRFSFRGNKLPHIADGRYQKSSICEHVLSFFRYWHHEELSHSRSTPFSERIAGLYNR